MAKLNMQVLEKEDKELLGLVPRAQALGSSETG